MLQQIEREPQNSKKKNKLARQRGCQTTEYSVYIERCNNKLSDLRQRMAEIDCTKDAEWRRLRKQVNAYKQRVSKREKDHLNQEHLRKKDRYIQGTLRIVNDIINDPGTF